MVHSALRAESYYQRGLAKDVLSDYQGAKEDFSKAIELNAEYEEDLFYQGTDKIWIKDYQGAIKNFSQLIELNLKKDESYIKLINKISNKSVY